MSKQMASQDGWELPSETARTDAYNAELLNRFRTGQFLTETDKREARKLIARGQT